MKLHTCRPISFLIKDFCASVFQWVLPFTCVILPNTCRLLLLIFTFFTQGLSEEIIYNVWKNWVLFCFLLYKSHRKLVLESIFRTPASVTTFRSGKRCKKNFLWTSYVNLSCHIRLKSESELCNCLDVKEPLTRSTRDIWNLNECNGNRNFLLQSFSCLFLTKSSLSARQLAFSSS